MPQTAQATITAIGIDIGKNSFHIVGQPRHVNLGRRIKINQRSRPTGQSRIVTDFCNGIRRFATSITA